MLPIVQTRSILYNLAITWLLLFAHTAAAQQQVMRHYTVKDGLPSNTIYNIYQDSEGFLWLCTDMGISRFDGHHFENITSNEGLPDNEVFDIKEDPWQRKWLWLYNGQTCYLRNGQVYTAENDSLCRQINRSGIRYCSMFINKDGNFCLGGKKILVVQQHSIVPYLPAISFTGHRLYYFTQDDDEYLADDVGIFLLRGNQRYVIHYSVREYNPVAYQKHAFLIRKNRNQSGFTDISIEVSNAKTIRSFNSCMINHIIPANDSEVALCSEKGLLYYNFKTGFMDSNRIELPGVSINRVFTDNEKNTWYITLNDGIYMRPVTPALVYNRNTGLTSNNVLSVMPLPDGQIAAGFDNGKVQVWDKKRSYICTLYSYNCQNRLRYLNYNGENKLLLGNDESPCILDLDTRRTFTLTGIPGGGLPTSKCGMLQGSDCYLGFTLGMLKYNLDDHSFTNYFFDAPNSRPDGQYTITTILKDAADTIWAGTLNGLFYISGMRVAHRWNGDSGLSQSRITAFDLLPDGGWVAGTHTKGIYIWHNGQLAHLTVKDGLSSNICRKVAADSLGNIWLATSEGLDKITRNTTTCNVYHFSQSDGLITNDIRDIKISRSKIYLATSEGIIVININQPAPVYLPRIYFTSLKANGISIADPRIAFLKYDQQNIIISYTGISFSAGTDIRYKYFLQGSGSDTVYTKETVINFSTVRPGRYQLMVWAGDKQNHWSPAPAVLNFDIATPYWQKKWFLFSVCLSTFLVLYTVYRYRLNKIKQVEERKTEEAKKIAVLEMQTLRAQIKPHFMFNALNAIQYYYNHHDKRSANHYMTSFAGLMRKTLTVSKAHWISLADELSILTAYIELEAMRLNHSFTYEITISPETNPTAIQVPALLLQPYVENAINHGLRRLENEAGKLALIFRLENKILFCRIEDNGIGMFHAAAMSRQRTDHQSMGMSIARQRIDVINRIYHTDITIAITDKNASNSDLHGVIIEIRIPQS